MNHYIEYLEHVRSQAMAEIENSWRKCTKMERRERVSKWVWLLGAFEISLASLIAGVWAFHTFRKLHVMSAEFREESYHMWNDCIAHIDSKIEAAEDALD